MKFIILIFILFADSVTFASVGYCEPFLNQKPLVLTQPLSPDVLREAELISTLLKEKPYISPSYKGLSVEELFRRHSLISPRPDHVAFRRLYHFLQNKEGKLSFKELYVLYQTQPRDFQKHILEDLRRWADSFYDNNKFYEPTPEYAKNLIVSISHILTSGTEDDLLFALQSELSEGLLLDRIYPNGESLIPKGDVMKEPTTLMYAAKKGYLIAVKALLQLESGFDFTKFSYINRKDRHYGSALNYAIYYKQDHVAEYLLSQGADPKY